MQTQPMKENELGKYVCVARGGCIHSPFLTILSNGVWVRYPDSNNPGSFVYSSAHHDCWHRNRGIDPELFRRTAPQWNCVDYPDGMHYAPGDRCLWCGASKEEMREERQRWTEDSVENAQWRCPVCGDPDHD